MYLKNCRITIICFIAFKLSYLKRESTEYAKKLNRQVYHHLSFRRKSRYYISRITKEKSNAEKHFIFLVLEKFTYDSDLSFTAIC